MGDVSVGKTSVVSGMIGKVLDNMKIDVDESSDELTFYKTDFLGKGFNIVDTPGLFGTKTKEIDGEQIRFSDTTRLYISEAHIVLYVCDFGNPVKHSHAPVLQMVLRTLDKLDTTIFVLNKMDTKVSLNRDDAYNNAAEIKKEFLRNGLRQEIGLTDEEAKRLNIVCVAADPKGKGLEHWLDNMEDYVRRSRIGQAVSLLQSVAHNADKEQLISDANAASVKDIALLLMRQIHSQSYPLKRVVEKEKENLAVYREDLQQMERNILDNRTAAQQQLQQLQQRINIKLNGTSLQTIGSFVQNEIGIEGETVTGYLLTNNINSVLSRCVESNINNIETTAHKIEKLSDEHMGFVREVMGKGIGWAAKQTITGANVLAFRNQFLQGVVKFKPWGAVKFAGNLTKALGWIGAAWVLGGKLWDMYKEHENKVKFQKIQSDLGDMIAEAFKQVYALLNDDTKYYDNFVPQYTVIQNQFKEQELLFKERQYLLENYKRYSDRLYRWLSDQDVIDADFEEVKDDVSF